MASVESEVFLPCDVNLLNLTIQCIDKINVYMYMHVDMYMYFS